MACSPRRARLIEDLTAVLASWNARELILAIRRMQRGSLSLIHLNALTLLEVEGAMPMGRLAAGLDVSVASTTGIVSRMEARGLVTRIHDERDRRVVLVERTEQGKDVFRLLDEGRRIRLLGLVGRLTDDDLAGHRALLEARAANLQDADGPVDPGAVGGSRDPAEPAIGPRR